MKTKTLACLIFMGFLLASLQSSAQIPNGDFETWVPDADGIPYPYGWETTNSAPDTSIFQYSPAYQGNYSMRVRTVNLGGIVILGGVASLYFPYTQRPSQFTACIKSTIMAGDTALILFSLWQGDSIIASPTNCTFKVGISYNNFTCLTFPITYISNLVPDSAYIIIASGLGSNTHLGTEVIVDALSFGFSTGIDETSHSAVATGEVFPNPVSSIAYIPIAATTETEVDVRIYNVLGKEVRSISNYKFQARSQPLPIPVDDLPNGFYQYMISGKDTLACGKIIVHH